MYEELIEGMFPLIPENIFYESETTRIYKYNDQLYKIYLKKEKNKRDILDYLLSLPTELNEISVLPNKKLKLQNNYGMRMNYIKSKNFRKCLNKGQFDCHEMIEIMKILSDNLKILNRYQIHFSDLHYNNIIIDSKGYPIYIDLDDAVVKDYTSCHISVMMYNLHNLSINDKDYKKNLIKYGNLDLKSLTLMLLNFMFSCSMDMLNYDEFQKKIEQISKYFDNEFLLAMSSLKEKDEIKKINDYNYYVGDYLNSETIEENIKVIKRRFFDENYHI